MPRAKALYEAVFPSALLPLDDPDAEDPAVTAMWAFPSSMESDGAPGALVRMVGVPSGGNSTLVSFACDDCAVEAARAKAKGASIFKEKMPIGEYGPIPLVNDSEGNLIGRHSLR